MANGQPTSRLSSLTKQTFLKLEDELQRELDPEHRCALMNGYASALLSAKRPITALIILKDTYQQYKCIEALLNMAIIYKQLENVEAEREILSLILYDTNQSTLPKPYETTDSFKYEIKYETQKFIPKNRVILRLTDLSTPHEALRILQTTSPSTHDIPGDVHSLYILREYASLLLQEEKHAELIALSHDNDLITLLYISEARIKEFFHSHDNETLNDVVEKLSFILDVLEEVELYILHQEPLQKKKSVNETEKLVISSMVNAPGMEFLSNQLEIDRIKVRCLNNRGYVFSLLGKIKRASVDFKNGILIAPDEWDLNFNYYIVLSRCDDKAAKQVLFMLKELAVGNQKYIDALGVLNVSNY